MLGDTVILSKTGGWVNQPNTNEIYYGGSTTTTTGRLYYMNSTGTWSAVINTAESTSSGFLAIALGTNSNSDGMLLKGFTNLMPSPGGTNGDKLYISGVSGRITSTIPSTSGLIVRLVGYNIDTVSNIIYFNPSNDYIELS